MTPPPSSPSNSSKAFEIIILGAGCAGLSLCRALLTRGFAGPILLLDRRTRFDDDRTWCFWDTRPARLFPPTARTWHSWTVRDTAGREAVQTLPRGGYSYVRGADFYAETLALMARHPNVTLCLNEQVQECREDAHGVLVRTDKGQYRAQWVFDGASPLPPPAANDIALRQQFFGQTVRAPRPVFNPAQATLMDFGVAQSPARLRFFYVLPFSPTEALIEDTTIGPQVPAAPDMHRADIAEYARARWHLAEFNVLREESGSLPMTTQSLPQRRGRRIVMIGTAAGAVKPSSGYAFARIQQHSARLADLCIAGRLGGPLPRFAPPKYGLLDTIFLAALHARPEQFPALFHLMFARVPPARLVRFLSETSTWQDDLSVLRVLPKAMFLRAALRSRPLWLPMLLTPR